MMAGANTRLRGAAVKSGVKNPGKQLARLLRYVFRDYGIHCLAVFVLILCSVLANVQGTMFTRNLIDEYIVPMLTVKKPDFGPLAAAIGRVAVFYAVGILSTYTWNRIMVEVTQGTLRNLRDDLFTHMELLPIRYFDTHAHGDIMSVYTNDVDTLRQIISQSIPQFINSAITVVSVLVSMIILSIPLTLVTLVMVAVMVTASRISAGKSGRYFVQQQLNLGKVNGYIEEMMEGQKVVKVFCHEEENEARFRELNEELFVSADRPTLFPTIWAP